MKKETLEEAVQSALDQIVDKNYEQNCYHRELRQIGSVITALPLKEKEF